MTKLSILNLVPKYKDETKKDAFDRAVKLAQFADSRSFERYWVAEHHNSPAVLSSATEVVITHILAQTERIKVGAGGVMLPNHTPYQLAEVYGTIEALYPHRLDLGVGRAPGTDLETAKLIYRDTYKQEKFLEALRLMLKYFDGDQEGLKSAPYPGMGAGVPITILGSSVNSAYVAAQLGLAYSFAGHFAPHTVNAALDIYRDNFKKSKYLDKPYTILGVTANIGENEKDAAELEFHAMQVFLQILDVDKREEFVKIDPDNAPELTSMQKFALRAMRGLHIGGTYKEAKKTYESFKKDYGFDELIAVSYIPEYEKLEKSFEILEDIVNNN